MKRFATIYLLLLCISGTAYTQALTPPEYPGGKRAFSEFLSKNLKWPSDNMYDTQGVVIVGFAVEKNGQLTNIRVNKSLSPAFDKEALRVIALSPKWIPAIQNNKFIKSNYTVPIEFGLKETTVSVAKSLKQNPAEVQQKVSSSSEDVYVPFTAKPVADEESSDKIFTSAEKVPTFPGGYQKFQDYIAEALKKENFISTDAGRVFIAFVVERDGSLTDIKVVRGVSQKSDMAALRLFKTSPKWEPATMNGRPVRFAFSYPIVIKPNN